MPRFINNLPFFCKAYGDVIYNQAENEPVSSKIERVQYNASLAITVAIRGTSQEKLYEELGLESLRTVFKAHILFLQINYNSKTIIPFQSESEQ